MSCIIALMVMSHLIIIIDISGLFQIAFNSSDWLLSSNTQDIELPKGEEYYWNVGIEKLENIFRFSHQKLLSLYIYIIVS
jgi:hypothetical protein